MSLPANFEDTTLQAFKDRPLNTETHSHDGPLGLLYHAILRKVPHDPAITFVESLDLIQLWIKEAQANEKAHKEAIETLRVIRDIKLWEALDLLTTEQQALTTAIGILSKRLDRPPVPINYEQVTRAYELLKHDHVGNQDHINHINVETLLPRVIEVVRDFDRSGRRAFLLTLGEIVELGSCAQGRTTRLLSYYISHRG